MEANIEEQLRNVQKQLAAQDAQMEAAKNNLLERGGDVAYAVPLSALEELEEVTQVYTPSDISVLGLMRV